jgi:hypothetical protein
MNVRAAKMNAVRASRFRFMKNISHEVSKPARVSFVAPLSRWEILMSRQKTRIPRFALAACAVLLPIGSALASQGPGGGMGTASSLTQAVMAVIVYGASALLIGTGLIGALRRR